MTRTESIEEISKLIPDCEKCPMIVENCKKQGHYDGCMKQREATHMAIGAIKAEDFLLRSIIEYLHDTGWVKEHDALVKGE